MLFILTDTPAVIFTVMGILHFIVSVSSLFIAAECPTTLVIGMLFGGIFVPNVLIVLKIYNSLCVKHINLAIGSLIFLVSILSIITGFCAFGLHRLNTICPDKLMFMAFIHGIIIPGIIVSCANMVNLTP